ncbi:MAG: lysophospholipid acyltransferase family protein [Ignavibacteria bacterium]|nr:lysophospholipid acyltransferase family protein [Ignavibacteria bacterium]
MKTAFDFIALKILPSVIDLYIKTLRIEILNKPSGDKNYVYIFWHSKMLIGWWLFRKLRSAALVSQSKDGDILNSLLIKWNYKVVRGSSSKGAKEALDSMTGLVKEGYNAVITPDGPRGPALNMKNGPLIISYKCIVSVIPVKISFSRKKILNKSWDSFEIPYPFSKCTVVFGNKYNYNSYLDENELIEFKSKLSSEMI